MAMGRREKDIKLLVEKFIKLVESLNPGERLSIKKVNTRKRPGGAKKTVQRRRPKEKSAKAKQRR